MELFCATGWGHLTDSYTVGLYCHNYPNWFSFFGRVTQKHGFLLSTCLPFFIIFLLLTKLDTTKEALFVLLYQAGRQLLASCIQLTLQWNQMSFCQRHNFQVDKVPPEDGGWIGGRQNLWLIASLMWQGPTVWGNWSALCVDTFCVSLSCRLLLLWPWGPRAERFTLQTLRGQQQLFYCGYWLVRATPLWLICLLT